MDAFDDVSEALVASPEKCSEITLKGAYNLTSLHSLSQETIARLRGYSQWSRRLLKVGTKSGNDGCAVGTIARFRRDRRPTGRRAGPNRYCRRLRRGTSRRGTRGAARQPPVRRGLRPVTPDRAADEACGSRL